jgi:hypothetical protein
MSLLPTTRVKTAEYPGTHRLVCRDSLTANHPKRNILRTEPKESNLARGQSTRTASLKVCLTTNASSWFTVVALQTIGERKEIAAERRRYCSPIEGNRLHETAAEVKELSHDHNAYITSTYSAPSEWES